MGNDEVRIKIKIDSNSQELVLMKQQVQDLGKSFNDTDSFANTFMKRINLAGHIYAGYQVFSNTLGTIASKGMEVNKEMQKLTNSLTMSSAVMMANNDIYGNAVSVTDKYKIAQMDAARSTELLQKANINTPHTMKQTVQIYDSMYFGMKKVGATTSDMVEITEKLSIAAGNKVGFDAFLSAMDGISTGTVEANSEMGRFLTSVGLTNEEIKNSTDVVQLFKDKLSGFQAISDFETKMSNLENSTDMFAKNLMKIPFDYIESKLPGIAKGFDSWAKSMNEINIYISNASSLSTYDELINKQYQLLGQIKEVKDDKFMWDSTQKEELKELNSELDIVFKKLAEIRELEEKAKTVETNIDTSDIDKLVNNTLNPYSAKIDEINDKWLSNYNILVKNGKDTSQYLKAWTKAIDDVDKEFTGKKNKNINKELTDTKKLSEEKTKQYKNYYEKIGDYSNLWLSEEQEIRKNNTNLTSQELDRLLAIEKVNFDKRYNLQKEMLSVDDVKEYFIQMGDYNNSWLIEESEFYAKWHDIAGENYPLLLQKAKYEYFDRFKDQNRLLLEDSRNMFLDMSSSLKESFETNFFDLIMGDFDDFKSYLKSFGNDIFKTIASPFATNLSKTAATTLAGLIGLQDNGLADQLKSAGLSLINGQWVGGSDTNGEPNIVVSATGEVIKGGSFLPTNVSTALSTFSAAKTGYSLINGGLTGALYAPSYGMGQVAGSLYGAGYTGLGNFAAGSANLLAGGSGAGLTGAAYAGSLATAGLLGGVGGYALGSIGDKLLGANTYAGTAGAAGGAIGAMVGSIVPGIGTLVGGAIGSALGSLIGGAFGKKKLAETGLKVLDTVDISNISNETLQSYEKWVKKSWVSSSTSWFYNDLTPKQLNQITSLFNTVDTVASIVGSSNLLSIAQGKYSGSSMSDELLPKYLIGSSIGYDFGTIDNNSFKKDETNKLSKWQWATDENKTTATYEEYLASWKDANAEHNAMVDQINVYFDDWKAIAKEMDTTIIELISSSIGAFQTTIRDYSLYNTSDDLEKLKLQMQFTNEDLIQTVGTVGLNVAELTVENFSEAYKKAISEDFSKSTFDTWESLADVLMSADSAAKAYADAITQIQTSMTNITRNVSLYNADDATKSALTLEYAQKDLDALINTMGVAGVTLSNFNDMFTAAMNEGLSADKLSNWEQLGNLLIAAADATKNYNEVLNTTSIGSALNITAFTNSFKTNENLLVDSARILGIKVAENYDELVSQFKVLSTDELGLTDLDLDYLLKAKSYLEESVQTQIDGYNTIIDTVTSKMSLITSIVGNLTSTIDKLRNSSNTSSQTLSNFYSNLAFAKGLAGTDKYSLLNEAVSKTIDYSSALFDSSNFTSSSDMLYAQLSAANQLEDMGVDLTEQKDSMQELVDNSYTQIEILSATLGVLSETISSSNSALNSSIQDLINSQTVTDYNQAITNANTDLIYSLYDKYNLDQYQSDTSGYDYWISELNSGKLTSSNIEDTIVQAANEWFYKNLPGANIAKFANGGIVTRPTLGIIGEAGYPELKLDNGVIPLKNPNDPLNSAALLAELKALRKELEDIKSNTKDTSTNTQTSRFIS